MLGPCSPLLYSTAFLFSKHFTLRQVSLSCPGRPWTWHLLDSVSWVTLSLANLKSSQAQGTHRAPWEFVQGPALTFLFSIFKTRSCYVALVLMEFPSPPRLSSNSWSSCLGLLIPGVIGTSHYVQLLVITFWGEGVSLGRLGWAEASRHRMNSCGLHGCFLQTRALPLC